ncbi:MAG TPA: PTS sugar transporter subunit IIA [Candidatus Hydrogenedentes bacterium]|nr:PTS sugar transporter subunit IIA [Candidatus Hydrogenedentota bacterium]
MTTTLDFIDKSQIRIIPANASKHDALEILIEAVSRNPVITDCEAFRKAVYEREAVQSTGIGGGVAVPHVRIPEVTEPTIALGIAPDGIDFASLDNRPVHIIILFATPKDAEKTYLSLLAKVMLTLRNPDAFKALAACRTQEEVIALL